MKTVPAVNWQLFQIICTVLPTVYCTANGANGIQLVETVPAVNF